MFSLFPFFLCRHIYILLISINSHSLLVFKFFTLAEFILTCTDVYFNIRVGYIQSVSFIADLCATAFTRSRDGFKHSL
jgi:tRNA(His) 5'-end guanylyltransferase